MSAPDSRPARRALLVWAVLVALTLGSWYLGHESDLATPAIVSGVIIAAALVKARLIILHFMEVGDAPLALRLVFEAWCLVVAVGLIAMLSG